MTTNKLPNIPMNGSDVLRLARELDVPGKLIRRGRKNETRAYATVQADNPRIVIAPASEHYTGAQ